MTAQVRPPAAGGGGGGAVPAGQLYAWQNSAGAHTLTGGYSDALSLVDYVDLVDYDPLPAGLFEFDTDTHAIRFLADCAFQAYIAPYWENPVGSGGVIHFELHCDDPARFYWAYNFDLTTNPHLPYQSGTPPIYPVLLTRAGDEWHLRGSVAGGTTAIDVTYIDLAITAWAMSSAAPSIAGPAPHSVSRPEMSEWASGMASRARGLPDSEEATCRK